MFSGATLLHLLLVPLSVWFLSSLLKEQAYGFIKVFTYTLANDLVKILLMYALFLFLLKYVFLAKQAETPIPVVKAIDCLTLSSGKHNFVVKFEDVLCVKSATPYVSIQTENKQHLHLISLKSISKELDARFVRIHRSCIVNMDKIKHYKSRLNGDYDVELKDGTSLRLSRNYYKQFKASFTSNSA